MHAKNLESLNHTVKNLETVDKFLTKVSHSFNLRD